MKKTKILFRFVSVILVIALISALPMVGIYFYARKLPVAYGKSYYAALPVKYDRLKSIKEDKIVVIGGSSVAFGIDSKIVEEELQMPCVNFGLYAAFGLQVMLDLSLDGIGSGDIVVVAPELSSQMFSDYKGYDYILEGIENRRDMGLSLGLSYMPGLVHGLKDYKKNASSLLESGSDGTSGVYALSSFDEYGDIIYPRLGNVMDGGYSSDNLPEIREELVSKNFVSMMNDYVKKAKRKGATVYFSFCPVNALSVADVTAEQMQDFEDLLKQELDCEVISSLEEHVMDAGYFYDSNFHMNDVGAIANTVFLINDLKRMKNTMTVTQVKVPEPLEMDDTSKVIEEGSFEGLSYAISLKGAIINGLDSQGMNLDTIEVPTEINGYTVVKIGSKAFENCKASTIILPEGIKTLGGELFVNATNLSRVEMNSVVLPEVGNNLLNGAPENLKIYVSSELYGTYITDYFWGIYTGNLAEK